MNKKLTFTIPGKPRGKERPRYNKYGSPYTPAQTVDYEKFVKTMFFSAHGRKIEKKTPVSVHITAVYAIPKSAAKTQRQMMEQNIIMPLVKPDIDNVTKIILDALNGCAWCDDAQVVSVVSKKMYGENPRVTVIIEALPSAIEKYRECE